MPRFIPAIATASLLLVSVGSVAQAADTTPPPAGDFLAQQGGDQWRASKLAGVNIYGPDNKKVGAISDVLMTKDGKATAVVIGVGGFLGIGEKDVAIPYDHVTFTQEPMAQPAVAATDAKPTDTGLGTPAQTNAAGTGATVAPGTTPAANGAMPAPAAAQPAARSTSYPDHGTVTYTADQLKAAPTFTYAK